MAMFNEDKNLKSGGCADEIAALIRDDEDDPGAAGELS